MDTPTDILDRADLEIAEEERNVDHPDPIETAVFGLRRTILDCTTAIVAAMQDGASVRRSLLVAAAERYFQVLEAHDGDMTAEDVQAMRQELDHIETQFGDDLAMVGFMRVKRAGSGVDGG